MFLNDGRQISLKPWQSTAILLLMDLIAEVQIKSTDSTWEAHIAFLISSPIFEVFAKFYKHFVMNMHVVCWRKKEKVNQRAAAEDTL